jgi:thioredoxin 1
MRILLTLTITFSLLWAACANSQNTLAPSDFAAKIKTLADAPLIDVRTPDEFGKGHLVNATNIDWNGEGFDKKMETYDKSKPILIYCLSGGRSGSAAKKMRANGFKEVYELGGGIMKWRGANLPETTENTTKKTSMTLAQYDAQYTNSEKLVLIDFYADWCGPCKLMKPYLEEIAKEMGSTVTVIRINADDNQQLCKDLKVDALPVLKLYKDNKLVWENVGMIEKNKVVEHLGTVKK